MMMRYHTGLGVGHAYAHGQSHSLQDSDLLPENPGEDEGIPMNNEEVAVDSDEAGDLIVEKDLGSEHDEDTDVCESDDAELVARVEMYGR
jgi:hypothetical protein